FRKENRRKAACECGVPITASSSCRSSAPARNVPLRTCRTGFVPPAASIRDAKSSPSLPGHKLQERGSGGSSPALFPFMRIVVDVMGGDHGCGVVIDGVRLALQADPNITQMHLVGRRAEIEAALKRARCQDSRLRIHHCSEVITMEDKPLD